MPIDAGRVVAEPGLGSPAQRSAGCEKTCSEPRRGTGSTCCRECARPDILRWWRPARWDLPSRPGSPPGWRSFRDSRARTGRWSPGRSQTPPAPWGRGNSHPRRGPHERKPLHGIGLESAVAGMVHRHGDEAARSKPGAEPGHGKREPLRHLTDARGRRIPNRREKRMSPGMALVVRFVRDEAEPGKADLVCRSRVVGCIRGREKADGKSAQDQHA